MAGLAGLAGLLILIMLGSFLYGGVGMLWEEGDPSMLGMACFAIGMFTALAGYLGMEDSGFSNMQASDFENSKEDKSEYMTDCYRSFIRNRRAFCIGLIMFVGGWIVLAKYGP